jgi:hypothetical protein
MKTLTIMPRGNKYWIEEVRDDGTRRMVIAFGTEEAAVQCLKDLQSRAERTAGQP